MPSRLRRLAAALAIPLLAATLLAAAGCGGGDGEQVTVADKGFSESRIVAEAYILALNDAGFDAELTSLGSTEIADAAITRGEIDIYPEYLGTSWLTVLGHTVEDAPADKAAQFRQIKSEYARRGLTILDPTPFSNGNEVACTKEAVDRHDLETLSDLGRASPNLVYSANNEHLTRPDGLPLLRSAYGVRFKDIKTGGISQRYRPIENGQADCVYAFGTDPKVGQLELVLLEDDKGQYSAGLSYQTVPVINDDFLGGLSESDRTAFTEAIEAADAALTQEAILPAIAKVEFDKDDPDLVAEDILANAGVVER